MEIHVDAGCYEDNINSNYFNFTLCTELVRTSLGVITWSHSRVLEMFNHQQKSYLARFKFRWKLLITSKSPKLQKGKPIN